VNLKCTDGTPFISNGTSCLKPCDLPPKWRCDKCGKFMYGAHGAATGGRKDLCAGCTADVVDAFSGWVPGADVAASKPAHVPPAACAVPKAEDLPDGMRWAVKGAPGVGRELKQAAREVELREGVNVLPRGFATPSRPLPPVQESIWQAAKRILFGGRR